MNRREALAALVALPEVSRVTVARPQPNDAIVVEVEGLLSQAGAEHIKAQLGEVWPERRIVVLEQGIRIKFVEA